MKNEPVNPASIVAVMPAGADGDLWTAVVTSRSLEGIPTIEIRNYAPADFRLSTEQKVFTAPGNFSFRTRLLELFPDEAELGDVDLAAYLIEADQTGASLADGKMLLSDGATLEDRVAQITRLPNDAVALTELPRTDLSKAAENARELYFPPDISDEKREALDGRIPEMVAETPLRAAFRAYLVESRPSEDNLITVFVMATENGFAFGFWSSMWGLFRELSESLPEEFSSDNAFLDDDAADEEFRLASLSGFLRHALESAIRSANDAVFEYGFAGVGSVVFAVPQHCVFLAEQIIEEMSEIEPFDLILIPESLERQILRGLLYTQLDTNPLVESNLCRDLYVRHIDNSIAAEIEKQARQDARRRKVMTAAIVPLCLLFGFIIGSLAYQALTSSRLESRNREADREAARLLPITEARKSYVENFRRREAYITQTLGKKDHQTIAISFLPEVDRKYPLDSASSSFTLSNIKLADDGTFEMKGVAAGEDLVTNFVRGLEFAENSGSDKRVFNNLTFEFRRETKNGASTSGAGYKGSLSGVPSGYIGWVVTGKYAPLVILNPQQTNKPNQPANNQNQGSGGQTTLPPPPSVTNVPPSNPPPGVPPTAAK